jgi:SRSO17 transposase
LAHGWIAGDEEFGRASEFRAALRLRGERYVLDVQCHTTVRDLERRRPPRPLAGVGHKREVPFRKADAWAAGQPESRWERVEVRAGVKGSLLVDTMTVRVRAKQEGRIGPEERLVVIRSVGESRVDYALTNGGSEVPLAEVVRAQRQRHRIEEMFGVGNGEAGLDHYEVRSWVGWHHHLTLSLVALWFLCLERRRARGKCPGAQGATNASGVHAAAPAAGAVSVSDRRGGPQRAAA